ncbi:hypothetical protein GYA01_00020 [Patescibacteria group bacterium]|jgi:membrane-bound lytic murein transglycosylase B|nr:hypothetical protein [Patescibacteria group bacterium]
MKHKLFLILGIIFLVPCISMGALNIDFDLEKVCENASLLDEKEAELSKKDFQELLEKCKVLLTEKKAEADKDVNLKASEKKTLENEIYRISSRITSLNNEIYKTNLDIKSLGYKIIDTELSIEETKKEIEEQKRKIALLLQAVYESGEKSSLEIFLVSDSISSFFDNFMYYEILNNKNQDILSEYQALQTKLGEEKDNLQTRKGEQESYVELQRVQKSASEEAKRTQEYLHSITEKEYQESLANKKDIETKQAEIEKRLIQLVGLLPGQEQPDFGTLLNIAKTIGPKVGVRPSFILAIISQESALGRNVGRCFITNGENGGGTFAGSGTSYRQPDGSFYTAGGFIERIAHYTRDLPPFLELMKELGYDSSKVPVSCWIPDCVLSGYHAVKSSITISANGTINCPKGYVPFGFGGAMGPAQFIPSTWNTVKAEVAKYTGHTVPNPWNFEDALTASAVYLSQLGAKANGAGEYNAASRYYGGSATYASRVQTLTWCMQQYIDNGSMSSSCEAMIFP